jgi:hypothetical protein
MTNESLGSRNGSGVLVRWAPEHPVRINANDPPLLGFNSSDFTLQRGSLRLVEKKSSNSHWVALFGIGAH